MKANACGRSLYECKSPTSINTLTTQSYLVSELAFGKRSLFCQNG
ncbi:MAG: hypothetical protein V7K14_12650 [Nostoc sp.]|nr:hypothetical protein [Nostoc sp. NMS7]